MRGKVYRQRYERGKSIYKLKVIGGVRSGENRHHGNLPS